MYAEPGRGLAGLGRSWNDCREGGWRARQLSPQE